MCGYDPFWIYDSMLEQQYLEQLEEDIKNKNDNKLEQEVICTDLVKQCKNIKAI